MEKLALILKDILCCSGKIAKEKQQDVPFWIKDDQSPVSALDIEVTNLAKEKLAPFLALPNHALIDEETIDAREIGAEYTWVLDPIGGTKSYINQLPFWGNYLGLLKNKKPFMGGVYIPAMGELFFHGGQKATYTKNAFTNSEITTPIIPHKTPPTPHKNHIIFTSRRYKADGLNMLDGGSLAINLCYPLIGRGIAAITRAYLWDICGAWPIAQKAGFGFFALNNGKELKEFSKKDFDKNLQLKTPHILCLPQNLQYLQAKIKIL